MIISNSRKFIFVHLHKCAGTSLTEALRPQLGPNDLVISGSDTDKSPVSEEISHLKTKLSKHSTAEQISQAVGDKLWNSYFTFSFVRHPLDRLVSLYEFLNRVRRNNEPKLGFISSVLSRKRSRSLDLYPDAPPWSWKSMQALLTTDDFSGFIRSDVLKKAQDARLQTHSLSDQSGKLLVDFVGKVENLAADWQRVGDRLQIKAELTVENTSERRFSDIRRLLEPGRPEICGRAIPYRFREFRL